MSEIIDIRGAKGKGGGSSKTPTETPDSLFSISYANILDLISEGEIVGLVNGARSIYLDNTPLQNLDGTYNFENVSVDSRTGTPYQSHIPGFQSVESETSIGVELRSDSPFIRTISNPELSAVRITLAVNGLSSADTKNGNINGHSVQYAIDLSTDDGAYTTVLTNAFTGKTTSTYQRSHRVDLPAGSRWNIRMRRLTANANSSTIADTTTIVSMTEIIDAKLRYPMSALVGIKIDASQFSSVPKRGYHVKLRIIRVPSNYDAEQRTYTGLWDGTFKLAYTNNPAWVFYDLITNDVYGLGNLIQANQVDKWRLYDIGRYCDVMVSNGKGGVEPRFTCNTYIQSRTQAFRVLKDMASVFIGISYYAGGQIYARADMPSDPVYTYTNANVVDGTFTYSGSSRTARYTSALVSWINLDNMGEAETTLVEYAPGIVRYGYRQIELTAFGCTSEAQAQRVGLHTIISDCLETQTIQFKVGLDSVNCVPGDIVRIADQHRAGRRIGGRIRSADSLYRITVDKTDGIESGDTLVCMLPSGKSEGRTVASVSGQTINVVSAFSELPVAQAVWAVSSSDLALQAARVISISDEGDNTFTITALQHVAGKFDAIDNGAAIDEKPVSIIPPGAQSPPSNVTLRSRSVIDQGIATHVMTIAWDAADNATAYTVQWRRDDGNWVDVGRTGTTSLEVYGIYAGRYLARVRAANAVGVTSIPALSAETIIEGKTEPPPSLVSLTATGKVMGIDLAWAFPTAGAADTQRTEIWYGTSSSLDNAIKLGDFAYPQNTHSLFGLANGTSLYFWGRLVDRSGNIGLWYPTGIGVLGQSSSDADEILSYLAGQIGKEQLTQDLIRPIELITPDMAGDAELFAGDDGRYAGVWTYITAYQEGEMALARRVDTVQAVVDENSAVVQQTAEAVASVAGEIRASWTVRLQVTEADQYYVAGIGVGISNETGIVQSNIYFTADRFAFINIINGAVTVPFLIQGGQTIINDAIIGTLQNKTMIQRVGGFLSVYGVGFGSGSEFVEWYGPDVGDISNCDRARAIAYKTTNGSAYFGGSLHTGTYFNAVVNTTNFSTSVTNGPFDTRGRQKIVTWGLSHLETAPDNPASIGNGTGGTSTITLWRKIGGGDFIQVAGPIMISYSKMSEQDIHWIVSFSGSVSATFTDNDTSTGQFTYEVRGTTIPGSGVTSGNRRVTTRVTCQSSEQ